MAKRYMLGNMELKGVHDEALCEGRTCIMHAPTDHHMSQWKLIWRDDRAIFERICKHSIGHPDPDQFAYWRSINAEDMMVHGCCGCCYGA